MEKAKYYSKDTLKLNTVGEGAKMWGVALSNVMLTYFEVTPNSRFEKHTHESEQITMVLSGELYVEVDEKTIKLKEGDVISLPSKIPHAVYTTELGANAVDAWSPVMEKYSE